MEGAGSRSAVGTIVERNTCYVILSRMGDSSSEAALEGFTCEVKQVPAEMRQSLTYDRRSENDPRARSACRLKLDIWSAVPYAPWQQRERQRRTTQVPGEGHRYRRS